MLSHYLIRRYQIGSDIRIRDSWLVTWYLFEWCSCAWLGYHAVVIAVNLFMLMIMTVNGKKIWDQFVFLFWRN